MINKYWKEENHVAMYNKITYYYTWCINIADTKNIQISSQVVAFSENYKL